MYDNKSMQVNAPPINYRFPFVWSHEFFPCFECDINKLMISSVESLENVSLNGGPWDPYSEADRQQDVERSAIVARIPDLASRILVSTHLRYKKAFIGRGLKDRIIVGDPPIQLMKGDRLEPTLAMRDVSKFEDLTPPFDVTFWRCFGEDRVLHDTPLFLVPGLGIDTHGPDTLHSWCLGPVISYIPVAILFLIGSSIYTPSIDFLSKEDFSKIGLMQIKKKLWEHYRSKRADPRWKSKGSEVWNLTLQMLGKK